MSELIDNARRRKDVLKHLILQIHNGEAPGAVKNQLIQLMGKVPYSDVVEVEQELMAEGMPQIEILKLCDLHSAALKGTVDLEGVKTPPSGHPVHTFMQENRALEYEVTLLKNRFKEYNAQKDLGIIQEIMMQIHTHFNALMDIDKHYRRKEYLLFPLLEKHGIHGPSTVMWGKHDETRELLKKALETLSNTEEVSPGKFSISVTHYLNPPIDAIEEMIFKEENILFPMSLDTLSDAEWYSVYEQSLEIGFCLYDPKDTWKPESVEVEEKPVEGKDRIQLPSGSMTIPELNAILNSIPFDLTFVDKDDTVRYFTQGKERIFERSRAILGRKVQLCHPPSSVHIVQKILDDFHSGKENLASFWITMKGRFILIEYFALRDENGIYLGSLEVSQDLTEKRKLEGEQRLLNYVKGNDSKENNV